MRLIDQLLPCPDFELRHSVLIDAPAATVREAIVSTRAGDDAWVRVLVGLRRLPAHGLRGMRVGDEAIDPRAFTLLASGPDALAYGSVGRFWRAEPDIVPIPDLASFEQAPAAGVAKLVLSFELRRLAAKRTMLSTFTHVRCDDTRTWLAMSAYWALIRPGIGLVRRRHLRQIRIKAEGRRAP